MVDLVERLHEQMKLKWMTASKITGKTYQMISIEDLSEAATLIETQAERIERLEAALKPSAETKAAYIGEFQFTVTATEIDESGEPYECQNMVTVPWTTIKEIMAAIAARALNGGE